MPDRRFNAGRERCSQMGCFFPASGRPGNLERTGIRVSGKAEQTLAGADGNRSRAGEHEGKENISNPKLLALMELRLKHPDSSLDELSKLLSEELNTEISKSNVNHLLRYVHAHAEELKNDK